MEADGVVPQDVDTVVEPPDGDIEDDVVDEIDIEAIEADTTIDGDGDGDGDGDVDVDVEAVES